MARQLPYPWRRETRKCPREARQGSADHRTLAARCCRPQRRYCGATSQQMDGLSNAVRARVQDRPGYSEDAHHDFARMHVAVTPACNISVIMGFVKRGFPFRNPHAWLNLWKSPHDSSAKRNVNELRAS